MTSDPLAAGLAALLSEDWRQARVYFEAALAVEETAQAVDGLSEALYWLDEVGASLEHRTRAYALYRENGDVPQAVRAALWLAWGHMGSYGNAAVANGWLQRAERLLQEAGECAEHGWLKQFRSKISSDATTSARHAREAHEIARQHGDRDLEVWSLSQLGRALVTMGHVNEGMAMLDEAVAAATAGEAQNLLVIGDTCCNMLSACDRTFDFDRATQWCQVVDEFSRRHHAVPFFHYCRVVYSGVLIAGGRWAEAESHLREGLQAIEKQHPAQKVYSASRLALLCVRQGRLEMAAQLLAGLETQGVAAEALVSLHLAQGRLTLADAVLENRLVAATDDLVAVPFLRLSVDTKLLLGDIAAAETSAIRLAEIAERSGRPVVQAQALLCRARVDSARGVPARMHFEHACALFESLSMPFDTAIARMEWARALVTSEATHDFAVECLRLSLSAFESLGARSYSYQASALLRELGAGSRPGPRVAGELTRRESEVCELLSHGLSNPEIGRRLFISPKTVEHHVSRILAKLSLRTRAEVMAWALRNPSPKSGAK